MNTNLEQKIIKMYNEQNKSTYEIANELNTYPNKIRRTLIKHGYSLKDKSAAQKNALESGSAKHPTKGKERTEQEKLSISQSMASYWKNMSEKEKTARSKQARDRWNQMTDEQKSKMQTLAFQAIRVAAKEGSKLEKFFASRIEKAGYSVRMHETIIPSENLEIDLYIPGLKTIIEVDGPSHFLPIWGEDKLQKQINADLRKSGVILTKGYAIIRVRSMGQECLSKREQLIEQILTHLYEIDDKFPPESQRFIEVE